MSTLSENPLATTRDQTDATMNLERPSQVKLSPDALIGYSKSFSEASEVTVNVTQDTEETSPLTPEDKKCIRKALAIEQVFYQQHQHDDEESSHDGSYFVDPTNLPSPKSDRRYSSSTTLMLRGSDASLSLSDDSEDHHDHHNNNQHNLATLSDHRVDLYPQQLSRIHSISSLVSGSSNRSDDEEKPSGRKSPVLGNHPGSNNIMVPSPASLHNTLPSPPTILSTSQLHQQQLHPTQDYLHPQAHAAIRAPPFLSPPGIPPRVQFSLLSPGTHNSSGSKSSQGLAYSDDSDSLPLQPQFHSFTQFSHTGGNVPVQQQQQSRVSNGFYGQLDEHQSGDGMSMNGKDGERHGSPVNGTPYSRNFSSDDGDAPSESEYSQEAAFKVYWQRWIMLFYMSLLNLLSDWTCYSVAPIAVLTEEAYGHISSEQLVVLFLAANAVATACEPILLSRLGLRKTVLFGALLLMIGSIIKSGGMPPIIQPTLEKGRDEWRVYLGFFLVGLSQPLYQCTPALLSASWFPEKERTLATGVALNANQVGIGFAFIFGTLLVKTSGDILNYFSLLSILSTLTFLGTLFQFDDAPPTPPSNTARVMRGTMEVNLPSIRNIFESVRNFGVTMTGTGEEELPKKFMARTAVETKVETLDHDEWATRIDAPIPSSQDQRESGPLVPLDEKSPIISSPAPSPANWDGEVTEHGPPTDDGADVSRRSVEQPPSDGGSPPRAIEYGQQYSAPSPQYQPVWDDRTGQYVYYPVPMQQSMEVPGLHPSQHYAQSNMYSSFYNEYSSARYYDSPFSVLPPLQEREEGVEPVLTLTPHRLDITIRDDQVWLSIKACMMRPGFIHSLVSFTVSGIVINTLSTFMDYLVRLNGAGREYTGIVGGSFQFVIMISSLLMGQFTDKTRAYYSIIMAMLVFGAFGLAECGVNLDADKGVELRISLIIVAALVGPLQPISTELGVETAYPLSENTVLVIQQLFSNLLSACFIPCFKIFKDFELNPVVDVDAVHPQHFTFSFYVLIVLHAVATVFFATFNGRYLRLEHEEERNETVINKQEQKARAAYGSFEGLADANGSVDNTLYGEQRPLLT